MKATQLIEKVSKDTGLAKKDAKKAVLAVFDTMAKTIKKEEVAITGFGKLRVRRTKPRWGRNPQTGEKIKIKAKKKIVFTAYKTLKEQAL